jgi:hypothetical protein
MRSDPGSPGTRDPRLSPMNLVGIVVSGVGLLSLAICAGIAMALY